METNTPDDRSDQPDPFTPAQRRELDHLAEKLELKMRNVEQKQETAYERMIGELEKMRRENAEQKAWIARWMIVTAGVVAALLTIFQFAFG